MQMKCDDDFYGAINYNSIQAGVGETFTNVYVEKEKVREVLEELGDNFTNDHSERER